MMFKSMLHHSKKLTPSPSRKKDTDYVRRLEKEKRKRKSPFPNLPDRVE
jgi:hypothetical protein